MGGQHFTFSGRNIGATSHARFFPPQRRGPPKRPKPTHPALTTPRPNLSCIVPILFLHDMPRAHNPGPSTLRNRNRVTNKTRLHIVHGSLDADPLAFDEDEEKARIVSTAGVDAEDANVSPHFLPYHASQPLMLSGAWWRILIGCHRENFIPRNADSLTFYRNTTFKLSCQLPRNATRLPGLPVVPGTSLPNNRMPTSQSRIMPDLWKTMILFTHPSGGVIQSHTSRHLRRLRKPHRTPSLMDSHISWMSATRSGSTRTTRKLVAREHLLKELFQRPVRQREPRNAVQRRRARNQMSPNPSLFPKMNSSL